MEVSIKIIDNNDQGVIDYQEDIDTYHGRFVIIPRIGEYVVFKKCGDIYYQGRVLDVKYQYLYNMTRVIVSIYIGEQQKIEKN